MIGVLATGAPQNRVFTKVYNKTLRSKQYKCTYHKSCIFFVDFNDLLVKTSVFSLHQKRLKVSGQPSQPVSVGSSANKHCVTNTALHEVREFTGVLHMRCY